MNLDDQLHSAAADVRSGLSSVSPPPFEPPAPAGSRLTLLALVALIVGGGWWLVRPSNDDAPMVDAVTDTIVETVPAPGPEPEPDPDADVPALLTPPDQRSVGITGFDDLPTSPMDQPQLDAYAIEPDTGVAIRRFISGTPGSVVQPVFSQTQTFNADGSLVLLYQTRGSAESTAGHIIVDAGTGEMVAAPDLSAASDIEDVSWDSTNPDRLYFTSGPDLVSYDVSTGDTDVAIRTGCEAIGFGEMSGTTTSGTSLMGLLCRPVSGPTSWAVANTETGSIQIGGSATVDAAPQPMISGTGYVVVDDTGVLVLDSDLSVVRTIAIEASSHTVAQDADGSDVLVATVYGGPSSEGIIVVADLTTGAIRVVVGPDTGAPYPPRGSQLSTAATERPDLIAVNTFSDQAGPLTNEIMLLELNGDESQLRRLAHHRSVENRDDGWSATSTVAISPDGSRMLFSSNWASDTIATYEIALP